MIGKILHILVLSSLLFVVSACATRSYHHESTNSFPIRERAITQSEDDISISASVPDADEAKAIFGVPVYNRDIQPVWLEIINNSQDNIRFAPTGLDPNYFSPLEVSYMHRKGFSKEARAQMDRRFHDSAMPRQIPPGETRSGYVFTHVSPGTKSFNVDVYSTDTDYSLAFFLTVPGFVPDHAAIDFETLYGPEEIHEYELAGFRDALADLPKTTSDHTGQQTGLPYGAVIVADGIDVLKSLLRAGWYETSGMQDADQLDKAHYMFGRMPDAVFRIKRNSKRDRNELSLWKAPLRAEGKSVWLAQITHFIGQATQLEQVIFGARIDPDIDAGRNYFLQNLWYAQSLEKHAWLAKNGRTSIENTRVDFNETQYFTDGYINVIWLSSGPISLLESVSVAWDDPPFIQ